LPVLSGYRKQDTLELELTTDYTSAYEQVQRSGTQLSIDDFEIIVPVSRVVTANPFSLDINQGTFRIASGTSDAD
jgi:hypothetical protein